jgi:hypothetical protein
MSEMQPEEPTAAPARAAEEHAGAAPEVDSAIDSAIESTVEGTAPTGHPAVDEVLRSLDRLESLPVDEHAAVYEQAHDTLRRALADAQDGPQEGAMRHETDAGGGG